MAFETISGEEFARRRKRLGLTQEQAAGLVRRHRVTVADWERLNREVDPQSTALLLAFELMPEKRRVLLMPRSQPPKPPMAKLRRCQMDASKLRISK
ncbi:XRE family transcriptional regulator [Azospirillum formosense]|uniref:helix-turn-helix domain-containing protein n=1 Tax=Azospirillum formosense TaxID=861533 RepID=UPI00338F7761